MKNLSQLSVFIASPGDVEEEREIVREVCEELSKNALCRMHSLRFHAVGWEDAIPAAGQTQEIINKLVEECDIFVCLFHKRFGSPSGKEDSGTLGKSGCPGRA